MTTPREEWLYVYLCTWVIIQCDCNCVLEWPQNILASNTGVDPTRKFKLNNFFFKKTRALKFICANVLALAFALKYVCAKFSRLTVIKSCPYETRIWWPKCRSQWFSFKLYHFFCQIFLMLDTEMPRIIEPFQLMFFWGALWYIYPKYVKMTLVKFIKIGIKSPVAFSCPSAYQPPFHVWTISCY